MVASMLLWAAVMRCELESFCVLGGAQDVNAQDGSLRRRASNAVCAALLPVGLGDPRPFVWGPNLAPRL